MNNLINNFDRIQYIKLNESFLKRCPSKLKLIIREFSRIILNQF